MRFSDLVAVSRAVSATRSRTRKVEILARLLSSATAAEAPIVVSYLAGRPRQERLGVGPAAVFAIEAPPAPSPSLDVAAVDAALAEIAAASGAGSQAEKRRLLFAVLAAATPEEQDFLRGLILRDLRQGALEGIMTDAVAAAIDAPPARVRRAAMLAGDLVAVSARALAEGPGALAEYSLQVGTPVQPMLAQSAESATEAMRTLGRVSVEWKLDGARIQVHRDGDRVAVFTRNLNDITHRVPEIVARARTFPASSFILDGEALLTDEAGTPQAFQDSMSRFGSEEAGDRRLRAFYFDVLLVDGIELVDEPLATRRRQLEAFVPDDDLVPGIVTADPAEAEDFYETAVGAAHEGVVVKDLVSPYEAGRRGGPWIKVKPVHTLDLVVLAAEWGSGRRSGRLSNLHLGARDPETGEFVMLGKTFKGLTDAMLTEQTERFLTIERARRGHVVYLEPEIVYEIAFDGVQRSTRYPGGLALRFARVKRFRPDKSPSEADTIDTVRRYAR